MKKTILIFISLICFSSLYPQDKAFDPKPKGMEFIPAGSFQMKMILNSEPKVVNATVGAFWMSEEITNAEYREFVDWARNNPTENLYQKIFLTEVVSDPKKGIMKDTIILKINPIEVSQFINGIIDVKCLERARKEYKDYFNKKKYNDYPVIGVSFKMAEYYCLWKTMIENEKHKEQGLPNVREYRIPMETEWEYVAQQAIKNKGKATLKGKLENVDEGRTNKWSISHLDNNVSEWVIPNKWDTPNNGEESVIIRGGSWKTVNSISARLKADPNSNESNVGFRIVQSYVGGQDNTPLIRSIK